MKKNNSSNLMIIFGLLLLGIGLYLIKTTADPQGLCKPYPMFVLGLAAEFLAREWGILLATKQ